jgi:nitrite reductase/ring-hydroxylating ferredoxin subunit
MEENSMNQNWINLGSVNVFEDGSIKEVLAGKTKIAVTRKGDQFGVISGVCNHVGGPLGEGKLDSD